MKILSNIIVNFASQALAALLSFAFIPFYLSQLGDAAFGVIGLFAIAQSLFSLFDFGISQFLTKEIVSEDRRLDGFYVADKAEKLFVFSSLISGCLLFLFSDFLRLHFILPNYSTGDISLKILLSIMGLLIGAKSIEAIYKSVLFGLNRQAEYNLIYCGFSILKVVGLVLLLPLWNQYGLIAFFGWQLICALFLVLTLRYLMMSIIRVYRASCSRIYSASRISRARTWGFITSSSLLYLFSMIYIQLDKIALAKSISLPQFGIYTFASTAAAAVAYFSTPVATAMYPEFCSGFVEKKYKSLAELFRRSYQLVNSLVLAFVSLGTIFSKELLLLWTRSSELSGTVSSLFVLLLLSNSCIVLAGLPNYLLIAIGRVSRLQIQMIFQIIIYLILLLLLIPRYGALGASSSWLVVSFFYLAVVLPTNLKFFHEISGLKLYFLQDLAKCALISFTVAIVFRLFQKYLLVSSASFLFLASVYVASLLLSILTSQSLKESLLARMSSLVSR